MTIGEVARRSFFYRDSEEVLAVAAADQEDEPFQVASSA
jgi:hypothetical protein